MAVHGASSRSVWGLPGCVPQAGQTSTSLLQAADAALYQAKQAGRDSIRQVAVEEG
ncbi:hypothetical protein LHK_00861 [Laribacter hongkongensis HLHK9]|uniref:GGDEF domain-containing protein n=1 Tax=Laribacter hongkongensis (strain HLHK9) TaxID=557598 RepID=C1D537_LARHH|nr:hypothetical protein LHK_00861 [Laribacter hongkongensis HLHK9]